MNRPHQQCLVKSSLTQRVGGKLLKLGTKDVHWTSKRLEKDARLLRQPEELTRAQQPARQGKDMLLLQYFIYFFYLGGGRRALDKIVTIPEIFGFVCSGNDVKCPSGGML